MMGGLRKRYVKRKGIEMEKQTVIFDHSKCISCGACARDCIRRAITRGPEGMELSGSCFLCGHCVAVCPAGAVSIPVYEDLPVEYDPSRSGVDWERMLLNVKFRRSVRNYGKHPVEQEKLKLLAEAGAHAATAANRQEISYVFVQEKQQELKRLVFEGMEELLKNASGAEEEDPFLQTIRKFYNNREAAQEEEMLFRNAPAVIYLLGDHSFDAGLAAQCMELVGCSLGLGFMYNGYLTRISSRLPRVREFLGIGDQQIQMCMLAGYPRVHYRRTAPKKTPQVTWL